MNSGISLKKIGRNNDEGLGNITTATGEGLIYANG
jgi:hypothetical protein